MKTILISWLGKTDFYCMKKKLEDPNNLPAPVERAACCYADQFQRPQLDEVVCLSNWITPANDKEANIAAEMAAAYETTTFCEALQKITESTVSYRLTPLSNPTDYSELYEVVTTELRMITERYEAEKVQFVFHISSGTGYMQSIWLLLSKTEYPSAIMVKTSKEEGLELVDFPFDIAVKNQPYYGDDPKFQNLRPETLTKIKWRSDEMHEALSLTANIARYDDMRVLVLGETGSGKELFAELIHKNSKRDGQPFITINCGAIPEALIESELFGHVKGAFTGADKDKDGCFKLADGGTLFLDEIGELPLAQQVKILRLTDRHHQRFTPVGGSSEISVDVRIIAATHRNLMQRVAEGKFREDLFYRLCDALLKLPSLRERTGDIEVLAHHFVENLNSKLAEEIGGAKTLSTEGVNFLRAQRWPGNVRELEATISRAFRLYSAGQVIGRKEIEMAMIAPVALTREDALLNQPFGDDFDIKTVEWKLRTHYTLKAIRESGDLSAAKVAGCLGEKKGTFTKQLRDNPLFRQLLAEHQDGRQLLARLRRE